MSVRRRTDPNLWEELRKTVEDESSLVTITLNKNDKGFGFNIRGGIDHPHVGCDPGIFVTAIRADSVAGHDGRLAIGDRILAVNNIRLDDVTHDEAVMAFRTTDPTISLLVEKGAERRVLDDDAYGIAKEEPLYEIDGRVSPDEDEPSDSSLQSTFTSFFKTTLGGLALGLMAGSITVFVGTRIYKALTK